MKLSRPTSIQAARYSNTLSNMIIVIGCSGSTLILVALADRQED